MHLSTIFRSMCRVLASFGPEGRRSHDRSHGLPVRLVLEELETRLTPSGALVAVPGPQFRTPGAPIAFSTAANAITVSDPVIGNGQDTVYVQVLGGTLTVSNTAALGAFSGNGSSLVTLTGTLAALNDALDGVTYVPPTEFVGSTILSVLIVPANGPNATAFVPLDFVAAPTVHLPAAPPNISADQNLTFSADTGNAITVSDPNVVGGTDTVWVEVSGGTLTLDTLAGMSLVSGDGSSFIEFTGTLAQINDALDGLTYAPATLFQGQAFLSITVNDYAAPTPVSGAATLPITVVSGSIAATIDGPPTQEVAGTGVLVFSAANGNAINLTDPTATDSIYLETNSGSLTFVNTAGLTSISFVVSPYYPSVRYWALTGSVPALNAALNGLEYQAPAGTTTDYLYILVNDPPPIGSAENPTQFYVSLTVDGASDIAPDVTGPGNQAFNLAGTTFSNANGNSIHVADGDANGITETAYVQVFGGTLTVANVNALNVIGNGTAHLVLTGNIAALNTDLDGLHYTPAANDTPDYLSVLVGDGARTGNTGLALTFDSSTTLAPILTVPGTQNVLQGATLALSEGNGNAIHLAAGDANGTVESVIVQVLDGQLAVDNTAGLATISGNGTSSVTMTGTLAALNTALDGLAYAAPPYLDTDFLNVAFGNNGSLGGPSRYAFGGLAIEVSSDFSTD